MSRIGGEVARGTAGREWSRRSFLGAGALGGLALAAGSWTVPVRAVAAEVAHPTAGAFRDSIGVNCHWDYLDTPYGYAYDKVKSLLVKSGIGHVRGEVSRAGDLFSSGVRTTVLCDIQADGSGSPTAQVAALAPLATTGAVAAVEGPNEPDLFWARSGWHYGGLSSPDGVLAWQKDLWTAVKGDARTRALPVIGPSFGKTYWGGGHPFGAGVLAPYVDYGNFHPYPSGNPYSHPYSYGGIAKYYWHSNFPSNTLDQWPINFTTYRPPFGDKQMMVTETGYSTFQLGQSEKVHALYTPRILLEYFRLGIARTYLYEFVDEFADSAGTNREAHFGLVRRDLTPKPAYFALKNLMAVLSAGETAEPARPFNPALRVRMPAGYDARAVHHLVLSKGGGNYLIALWHEVSANDISGLDASPPRRPIELSHPAVDVTVSLGQRPLAVSAQYLSDAGDLRVKTLVRNGNDVQVVIGDRVTLLSVRV